MKAIANVIQERRLLEEVCSFNFYFLFQPSIRLQVDHPFVVNLRYAFQDDENCFFVLDLMLGGDLRCSFIHTTTILSAGLTVYPVHLDRLGSLSEETVRFYMAELSSALCFLHEKHIMHRFATHFFPPLFSLIFLCLSRHSNRDIKPDNILLDERGHAHLTDFNIAVHYSERRLLTGVAGSMAYMAPEILHKRGYTYPIDWWSLGVCAYELIFGRRPFRGRTNTALTLSISKDALRFPENAEEKCSGTGLSFIRGVRSTFRPAPHLAQVILYPAVGEGPFQAPCM
jgi:serine/threonine kinase 32